jgi:hypothetical protein
MGTILIVGSILSAALSRQLTDEFKAWTPRLIEKIVRIAVSRLPESQRDRYSEEWSGFLTEIPGEIGKILSALGLVRAVVKINWDARREREQASTADRQRSRFGKFLTSVLIMYYVWRHVFGVSRVTALMRSIAVSLIWPRNLVAAWTKEGEPLPIDSFAVLFGVTLVAAHVLSIRVENAKA